MKKLCTIISIMLLGIGSLMAQAPSYTDFEWDIVGFGFAIPIGENDLSSGVAFGGEVRFNLTDYLSIGIGSDYSFFDAKEFENIEEEDNLNNALVYNPEENPEIATFLANWGDPMTYGILLSYRW